MAEHGFTPGPWHAQACNSWNVWSKDCKVADPIRCAQAEPYRVPSDEERIANARLIAASPTLLEALIQAAEEIEDLRNYANGHGGMIDDIRCDYARAAITLATGKDA